MKKEDVFVYDGDIDSDRLLQKDFNKLLKMHNDYIRKRLGLLDDQSINSKKAKKVRISNAFIYNLKINSIYLNYIEFDNCTIIDIKFANEPLCLSNAKFTYCELINCSFNGVDLSHVSFESSIFSDCIFDSCYLPYVNFNDVIINDAIFNYCRPKHTVVGINCIGSRGANTLYFIKKDKVFCGCWNGAQGGSLEKFKKRVETEYGEKSPKGSTKRSKTYYAEYMNAIKFFEAERKLYAK
jgi:hypothetical protein